MSDSNRRVEHCVEQLCDQGCERVAACIRSLEAGEPVDEVQSLSPAERQVVLRELQQIMAPYQRPER